MIRSASTVLVSVVVSSLLASCQHVAPYEREHLARRSMDVSERESANGQFESHVHEAREGAGGGGDTSGGGCGCN